MNVGATSVTDYGKYYAWGETKACGEEDTSNSTNYNYNSPNSYTKTYYYWDTYKWCNGTETSLTKYCEDSEFGTVDNKTVLDAEDDAATQNWGGAWRMPTYAEQQELLNNCYWVWTSSYNDSGVAGYIVYAAKSSSEKGQFENSANTPSSNYSLTDSHIFLPAAGIHALYYGEQGYYSSSSLYESGSKFARFICFYPSYRFCDYSLRCNDHSVRAVCE